MRNALETNLPSQGLPLNQFWAIMEAPAQIKDHKLPAQEKALNRALEKLSDEELIAFKITYESVQKFAFRWDLWAAVYLAAGGCGDDSFIYFCNWLIGRGELAFYKSISNPDSMADFDLKNDFGEACSCEWDVLPSIIWDKRHPNGPDLYDLLPEPTISSDGPAGEPFPEDDMDYFRLNFPRLHDKYMP